MAEPSVLSVTCSENTALSTPTWRWHDLDAVTGSNHSQNTKMFFVETPTNPMMKVADIQALSEIAKSVGALMVVDNTFLTPYFQNPLKLGADIVTHSSTKYLGGHNDTLSGIVVVKDNEEIAEKITYSYQIPWKPVSADGLLAVTPRHQDTCRSAWTDITRMQRRWQSG